MPTRNRSICLPLPAHHRPWLICCLALCFLLPLRAQDDFNSTLPILLITTNDIEIPDEPKIDARLQIIDNGPGASNRPTDSPTTEVLLGIERRGSTSQTAFPKVGYALETRDENGDDLEISLLGFPQEEDWVLHGPYSDKSLVRNALAYELAGRIMAYAPRIRLTELLINGEYQGVYLFTERIKRDNDRVDIARLNEDENSGDDLTGGYILKIDKFTGEDPEEEVFFPSDYRADTEEEQTIRFLYHYPRPDRITAPQRSYIESWIGNFEDVLAGSNYLDPVLGYRRYVDLQSFVDFLIINEISRNVDGYRLSTYMYKDKDSDGGRLHMGPVWDFNLAFGNANYCGGGAVQGWGFNFGVNCPSDPWQIPFWWDRLLDDPEFQDLLADRWRELRSGPFSNDNLNATIDSLVNEMGDAADRNFDRWPVLGEPVWPNLFVGDTYAEEVDYLKQWTIDRAEWMDGAMPTLTPVRNPAPDAPLRLFPNPTAGTVSLTNAAELRFRELRLYDARGRQLLRQRAGTDIDLGPLPPGFYVVRALDDQGRWHGARLVRR